MPADPRPGWETCETCGGEGALCGCGAPVHKLLDDGTPCPDCVRGEQPTDRLVEAVYGPYEAAVRQVFIAEGRSMGQAHAAGLRAALLAARREEGDE